MGSGARTFRDRAAMYCKARPVLRLIWLSARPVYRLLSGRHRGGRAALKRLYLRRALRKVVLRHKAALPPAPYAPLSAGRPRPDGPGCYVRLDYWAPITAGGSYGHTCYVAKELNALNPGLRCLLPHPYPLLEQLGVRQELAPAAWPEKSSSRAVILQGAAYESRVLKWISRCRPSFIYERLVLGNAAAAKAARVLNIPYIAEYNGSELEMYRSYEGREMELAGILEDIEEYVLRQASVISVVSRPIKQALVQRGFAPDRICVNPNGVDAAAYSPLPVEEKQALRAGLGFKPEDVVLAFIGTFGGWHGVDVLAAALPEVLRAVPQARFLLIGDGNFRHLVDSAVSAHGLGAKVVLPGLVPQEDGRRLLRAADIYLSPHSGHMRNMPFFGSPTKLFEYMGLGGGIVGTDLEQIGRVLRPALFVADLEENLTGKDMRINNERAVLCRPGSVEEFTRACVYLALRPAAAAALGRNARAAALGEFTWQAHVQRLRRFAAGDKSASWEDSEEQSPECPEPREGLPEQFSPQSLR